MKRMEKPLKMQRRMHRRKILGCHPHIRRVLQCRRRKPERK